MADRPIQIIGAGLTGPLLSILLAQRGYRVEIFERRPDIRRSGATEGKSINLALSARGIHALEQADLWEAMRRIIVPMRGRIMHSSAGELTFQPYGKDDSEVINSISRAELNKALLDAAETRDIPIHFEQRLIGFDLKSGEARMRDERTLQEKIVLGETATAADGSGSAVRAEMLHGGALNFSQQFLDYGYKELTIPAARSGEHLLEKHALHIWPRGAYMLIALPNIDGTFGCILFLPFEGEPSFASLRSEALVLDFFHTHFRDALARMPELARNYFANPVGSMVTIRCSPWHAGGKALLIGDAAHAIVPFFGQGLNCAFEDCTILTELLDRHGPDWAALYARFEIQRKQDTDAIADLAIENFTEMRDRVADPRFLFRKKVEIALEKAFPGVFVPKYSMVTFHRVPYSVAASRGKVQDRILGELCQDIDQIEQLDRTKARQLIERNLGRLVESA